MKTSFYCSWIFCFFLLLGGISFMTLPVQAQNTWFELNTQSDYWLFERDPNLGVAFGGPNWGLQVTGVYGKGELQVLDRNAFPHSQVSTYYRTLARLDAHLMYFLLGEQQEQTGTGWYIGLRTENIWEIDRDPAYAIRFLQVHGRETPIEADLYSQLWIGPAHGFRFLVWDRLALDFNMGMRFGVLGLFRDRGFDLGSWLTLRAGYRFTKP
jgi:hypothetical protein